MNQIFIHHASSQLVVWQPWSACRYGDGVAVFSVKLPEHTDLIAHLTALLQPDELARAQRYVRPEDRHRFVVTRGVLRIIAGKYLNQPPASIQFDSKINKKPELRNGAGWHINVAHSGHWGLVAVSKADIGVDVEQMMTDFSFEAVLRHSFSADEQEYLAAADRQRPIFYQLWTRKEALVKATGKGIDDDFARIPSLDGLHRVESNLLGTVDNWTVHSFDVSPGYPAAVAHQYAQQDLKFYTLESGDFADYES